MQIIHIADYLDSRLDAFRLNERQLFPRNQRRNANELGLFVAEGDLVVERAINQGCKAVALLCSQKYIESMSSQLRSQLSIDVFVADIDTRREVTGLGVPLDALGVFERPPTTSVSELLSSTRRVVVLEAVDNPTNVGAIVRSAVALGWDTLILDPTSADPYARRALRVSMGTAFSIRHCRAENPIAVLKEYSFKSVALTPNPSAIDLRDISQHPQILSGPIALFLGAERSGLLQETMGSCDIQARIPMQNDVDSLNVANAASIALYALRPTI